MGDDGQTIIRLQVEGNAKVEIQNTTEAIKNFEAQAGKSLPAVSTAFSVFSGTVLGELFVKAAERAFEAAHKLFDVLVVEGVSASAKHEQALTRLNATMQVTGTYSEAASKDFQEFAKSIQNSTNVNEDAVISQLQTAKTLGLTNEEAKKLTRAAIELSSTGIVTLDEATLQLGRTFEGNLGRLGRTVPILNTLTSAQLKAGEAADLIIKRFGGEAAAQTLTYQGSLNKLTIQFEDAQKAIGSAFTTNGALLAVLREVGNAFQSAAEYVEKNKEALKTFVTQGIIAAIQGMKAFADTVDIYARREIENFLEIDKAIRYVAVGLQEVTSIFSASAAKRQAENVAEIQSDITRIQQLHEKPKAIQVIDDVLNKLAASAKAAGDAEVSGATRSTTAVGNLTRAQIQALEVQKALAEQGKKLAETIITENDPTAKYKKELLALEAANKANLKENEKYQKANQLLSDKFSKEREADTVKVIQEKEKEIDELTTLGAAANADQIQRDRDFIKQKLEGEDEYSQAMIDFKIKEKQREDQIAAQRFQATETALSNLSTLQSAKTSEIAAVGKAAAIAKATIDTYVSANESYSALASIPYVGPALGAAAAAAAIAAGLINVSNIAGIGLAGGIDSVPGIGTRDSFPAVLAPGERVVPTETNRDLKAFLNQQSGTSAILSAINENLKSLSHTTVVNVGGRDIVNTVRRQLRGGRTLSVG